MVDDGEYAESESAEEEEKEEDEKGDVSEGSGARIVRYLDKLGLIWVGDGRFVN